MFSYLWHLLDLWLRRNLLPIQAIANVAAMVSHLANHMQKGCDGHIAIWWDERSLVGKSCMIFSIVIFFIVGWGYVN